MNEFKCEYYNQNICRSCTLLEIGMLKAQENKKKTLEELFPDTLIHDFIGPMAPKHSRYKAKFYVGGTLASPKLGPTDATGTVSHVPSCGLYTKEIQDLAEFIPKVIQQYSLTPYDTKQRKGELKGINIYQSFEDNQLGIRFFLRSTESTYRLPKAISFLQEKFPNLLVASYTVWESHAALQDGPSEHFLTKQEFLSNIIESHPVPIGPSTFFQVTPSVAKELYNKAAHILKEYKVESLVDIFCGVGGFSQFSNIKNFHAVEFNPESIKLAKLCSPEISHQFIEDDAIHFLNGFNKEVDAFIFNPPRRGISEDITSLLTNGPKLILYASCNPVSLKKDYEELLSPYYQLKSIQPFDMFPLTKHGEYLSVFEKINT